MDRSEVGVLGCSVVVVVAGDAVVGDVRTAALSSVDCLTNAAGLVKDYDHRHFEGFLTDHVAAKVARWIPVLCRHDLPQ